jgi:hypothetical protein
MTANLRGETKQALLEYHPSPGAHQPARPA